MNNIATEVCNGVEDGVVWKVLRIEPPFKGCLGVYYPRQWHCGYARVPVEIDVELTSDFSYFSQLFDAHGGITYCQQEDDGFWIGFDTIHGFDDEYTQSQIYVEGRAKCLARQVASHYLK